MIGRVNVYENTKKDGNWYYVEYIVERGVCTEKPSKKAK